MTQTFSDLFGTIIANTPYMAAIGARYVGAGNDGVTMALPWRENLVGDEAHGVLASGVVTALLDNCCGMAVWHRLNAFQPVATLDLRIDYMRAARPQAELLVTAHCFAATRSVGFVRAFAYEDSPDDPVAAAQAAFSISQGGMAS